MGSPLEILIIEDNEDDLYFIKKALRGGGHRSRVFNNGSKALQYLRDPEAVPDLVLLDYHLPGMNGFKILQECRELNREYAFIFLTVESNLELVIQAMQSGALDYIVKSGRLVKELPAKIEHVMRLHQTRLEKKRAEEALRRSLADKEILLKEIHHRVKNNMQIISSLLNLTLPQFELGKDQSLVQDFLTRIQSISLVHEEIYLSENLSEIDMGAYIQDLVTQYAPLENDAGLTVEYQVEVLPCIIGIEEAIPFGLIINEAVTNAIKHAFPDRPEGTIAITLSCEKELKELRIKDNGIGIRPADQEETEETLGLQLIRSLTEQLRGSASWTVEGGTLFTLSLPGDFGDNAC